MIAGPSGVSAVDLAAMALYCAVIVYVGLRAARFTQTTSDFFFGGQRFPWWLVAVSCVATLVGAYSFQQYSQISYKYGFAAMAPYTNEWFVLPLFLIGWLPIVYYSRVQSIPEYFERRFDRRTRLAVLVVLLIYLEVYIGINLLTIGQLLSGALDWDLFGSEDANVLLLAGLMAFISAFYLHAGGQTSVLMTDLVQGLLLLVVGLGLVLLGVAHLGGLERFWEGLPLGHRLPLAPFNYPPGLHAVGDFWNDAMVGTFAFYCINQGILMRFMSAKSVRDGRKAMIVVVALLMPLAALAVCGTGLVGRSMHTHGMLPTPAALPAAATPLEVEEFIAQNVFVTAAREICRIPGMFGLVIAAVVAALMSTLDTLITAVSAVAVNDIWRTLRPGLDDRAYLAAARRIAIVSTVVGLALIPLFRHYDSIYQALSFFTSLIIPPLAVVILLAILWPRFGARAAFWTLILGSLAMAASVVWPQLIIPFAHGVELAPSNPFPYMRGLYGLAVSLAIAVALNWLDRSPRPTNIEGLVVGTLDAARAAFKGGVPSDHGIGRTARAPWRVAEGVDGEVRLPAELMRRLAVEPGDLLYVSDARWWLGGFRSLRAHAGEVSDDDRHVLVGAVAAEQGHLLSDRPLRIEKLM